MSKKWTLIINLGIVLALVMAVLPMQGALANSKSGNGFVLLFPDNGLNCAPFAKVAVMGKTPAAKVEYTFFSWGTGSLVKIGSVTAPFGEAVRFYYPGGIGDGRYSVAAAVYDEAGNLLWKAGGKWYVYCEKALNP